MLAKQAVKFLVSSGYYKISVIFNYLIILAKA